MRACVHWNVLRGRELPALFTVVFLVSRTVPGEGAPGILALWSKAVHTQCHVSGQCCELDVRLWSHFTSWLLHLSKKMRMRVPALLAFCSCL